MEVFWATHLVAAGIGSIVGWKSCQGHAKYKKMKHAMHSAAPALKAIGYVATGFLMLAAVGIGWIWVVVL